MLDLAVEASGGPLRVSRLALGCDHISARWADDDFFGFADRYVAAGGNCLDTARVYCGGESEALVGRWLKRSGRRHDLVLSTKGCHPPLDNMSRSRLSRQEMAHDLDESLCALGTDCVDLYWLHRDDPSLPAGEIIESLNELVKAGKIRAPGCSNWTARRIEEANRYAAAHGLRGFAASQIQWSLAETREEIYGDYAIVVMSDAERAFYARSGLPVFAYHAQAGGYFSKLAAGGPESLSEKTRRRFDSPGNRERLPRLQSLARRHGVSLSAAALGYISCNRLPAVAIMGFSSPTQLAEGLEAASLALTPEETDALV